jgi:ERCC4-related helicase
MSSPWNIYALAEILGRSWDYMQFKKTFFTEVNMGMRWPIPVVKKNIEPLIAQLVNKLGSTVKLEDCFDVPDQIFQTEYFELTKEQNKAISEIEDTNHLVRWTKIHQICGGTLKGDGYVETKHFKCEKTDRLLELISEHKQIAIVCRYNAEINYLYKKTKEKWPGRNAYKITGMASGESRHSIVEQINKNYDCIVFINSACSEGYGLPYIQLMVFYSYDFSLKNYIQMIGRIQRANNIKKNIYLSLVIKKTIDEDVFKSIQKKEDFQIAIYKK